MTTPPDTQPRTAGRVIYTRMVADLFHPGHVAFLKTARALGDRLHVYVLEDDFVSKIKPLPIMDQSERLTVVGACRYVDEVHSTGPLQVNREFMNKHGYSTYAMAFSNEREAAAKWANCRDLPEHMVAVIPYTEGISSTIIRSRILARDLTTPKIVST